MATATDETRHKSKLRTTMKITITCNAVPGSIADKLGQKLGRPPTNAELNQEVRRILAEGALERKGKA
jgi:hypothetical protein